MKKVKLIINPIAGRGIMKSTLRLLKKLLKERDPTIDISFFLSGQEGDIEKAAKEAIEAGCETIIAAGGDGTINSIVSVTVGTNVKIGIIPLGRGNVFAQEIGIPRNIKKALRIISDGNIRTFDVGKINGRYFIWTAGIGGDAFVAREVREVASGATNVIPYFTSTLKALKNFKTYHFELSINGEKKYESGIQIMVGNAVTFGAPLNIKAIENCNDGFFDVCVIKSFSITSVIRGIIFFLLKQYNYYKDVKYLNFSYYRTNKIKVNSEENCLVHVDGEVIGSLPMTFEIVPSAIKIICPK